MKKEREDWTRLYHKTLKGLEAMIDVQKMLKDMKKIAEETNMTIMEMEGMILIAIINNQVINTMNITQILEDLWYVVQSDMCYGTLWIWTIFIFFFFYFLTL